MIDNATKKIIKQIDCDCELEVYVLKTCPYCKEALAAINQMVEINPNIKLKKIDVEANKVEARKNNISVVPTIFIKGRKLIEGKTSLQDILIAMGAFDKAKMIKEFAKKSEFDVIIIGGGPAGATSGIYCARKGLKTGIVCDKFGGQLLETVDIENFVGTTKTQGIKLVKAIEEHAKEYDIDVMMPYFAKSFEKKGKGFEIMLDNGAVLQSKTIIIATGAKWRRLGVRGENKYLNKGVHFCQHCDGPMYKGKNVFVVGGGNSGVEAAIDLANICKKVTLLEYQDKLRADEVLQKKLNSIKNISVIMSAEMKDILGDGKKVKKIEYTNLQTKKTKRVDVDALFVQIGQEPNTKWLGKKLKLNKQKEIIVDGFCKTSVEGMFACGDVSSTPYKQIVIAIGEGAKAALSAFDYLARGAI